jgi:hypothetical protein
MKELSGIGIVLDQLPNRLPVAESSLRSRGSPNSASISEMRSGCLKRDVVAYIVSIHLCGILVLYHSRP